MIIQTERKTINHEKTRMGTSSGKSNNRTIKSRRKIGREYKRITFHIIKHFPSIPSSSICSLVDSRSLDFAFSFVSTGNQSSMKLLSATSRFPKNNQVKNSYGEDERGPYVCPRRGQLEHDTWDSYLCLLFAS